MPRYVQVQMDDGTYGYVRVERRPPVPRVHLHTSQPSFISPIDGTPITDRKTLREHQAQHDVVTPSEFGPNEGKEYFERAAEERAEYYQGTSSKLKEEIKQDTIDAIHKVSQGYKPSTETVDE